LGFDLLAWTWGPLSLFLLSLLACWVLLGNGKFSMVSSFSFLVHSVKHGINPFCYLLTAILIIANGLIFQSFKKYLNPQKHFFAKLDKRFAKKCKKIK
jgi:hypothetical protein